MMRKITKRQADRLVKIQREEGFPWDAPVVLCVNDTWYDIRELKDSEVLHELENLKLTYLRERRAD